MKIYHYQYDDICQKIIYHDYYETSFIWEENGRIKVLIKWNKSGIKESVYLSDLNLCQIKYPGWLSFKYKLSKLEEKKLEKMIIFKQNKFDEIIIKAVKEKLKEKAKKIMGN